MRGERGVLIPDDGEAVRLMRGYQGKKSQYGNRLEDRWEDADEALASKADEVIAATAPAKRKRDAYDAWYDRGKVPKFKAKREEGAMAAPAAAPEAAGTGGSNAFERAAERARAQGRAKGEGKRTGKARRA